MGDRGKFNCVAPAFNPCPFPGQDFRSWMILGALSAPKIIQRLVFLWSVRQP